MERVPNTPKPSADIIDFVAWKRRKAELQRLGPQITDALEKLRQSERQADINAAHARQDFFEALAAVDALLSQDYPDRAELARDISRLVTVVEYIQDNAGEVPRDVYEKMLLLQKVLEELFPRGLHA